MASSKQPLPEWISGRFKAPKRDELGERLIIIEDGLLRLIDDHQPDFIAYEEPWQPLRELLASVNSGRKVRGGFNVDTINLLQMIKGTVCMAAARRSTPTEGHLPRTWRAVIKLPQKPNGADDEWVKRETMAWAQRLGAKVKNFDEADSWGLAFFCLHGRAGIARATDDLFAKAKASL